MNFPFSLSALSRAALVALALTFTVSCLPNSSPFAGGGPFNSQPSVTGSGGDRTKVATTTRSRRPAVAATSVFFGGGGGYGSGYHSPGYCRSCGYNPCRCNNSHSSGYGSSSHSGHGSSHSSHSRNSGSSSSRSSSSSSHDDHKAEHPHAHDTYRIAGGSVRSTQTKPSGYHSVDWYKSRGYDTSKLKLENEHGQSKGSSSKSKSSGSSSKSKSSSKKSSDKSSSSKSGSRRKK